MTPRSKRYFAIRRFRRYLSQTGSIVRVMTEWTKPIPKYPPGTIHPGGPAFVGDSLPELMIHRSRVETMCPPVFRPLQSSSCIIPHDLIDQRLLQMPVADLKMAINEQTASDLVKKAIREAYGRLPDFAQGNITIADK